MSIEYIREIVNDYFIDNFNVCEVELENHSTIDPSMRDEPWAKLSFRFTSNEQITLGTTPKLRRRGSVQVDIYTKQGKGAKAGYLIEGAVELLFTRLSLGGIEFGVAAPLPSQEVSGWSRLTVRCPYYYDY